MQLPITDASAAAFAREWIAAWNSRDPERIAAHYAPDVEYESPFAESLVPGSGGLLRGAAEVREYVRRGLAAYPDLRFTLRSVSAGSRSVVIEYDGVRGLIAAECLTFGEDGRIVGAQCHYRPGELHVA